MYGGILDSKCFEGYILVLLLLYDDAVIYVIWGRLKTCRNQFMQVERKRPPHVYNRKQCVVVVSSNVHIRNMYYETGMMR